MTQTNYFTMPAINRSALTKRMLIGYAVGFVAISFFVFAVKHPNPAWGKYWIVRPLVLTPLAGACGGAFNYLANLWGSQGGWTKIPAMIVSVIGFIIAIWMGIILGLGGTLWN